MLAFFDGLQHECLGRLIAADQFDDDSNFRVIKDVIHAGGENTGGHCHATVRGDVQIGYPLQNYAGPDLAADNICILLKQFDHPGANVAESYETNLDIAQCSSLASSVLGHASISSRMPFTNAGDSLSPNLRAISIASLILTFLGISLRNISS